MQPTQEQQNAVDLFSSGRSLRIDAYAGAGKTSTLVLLAQSRMTRGLYLAFNRSIAAEAQRRVPVHVRCSTSHSIAFRGVRRHLGYPEWKLAEKLTTQGIAEGFRMPAAVSFLSGVVLPRHAFAFVLLETMKRFTSRPGSFVQAALRPLTGQQRSAESRLLYVGLTRARLGVQLPRGVPGLKCASG